MISAIKNSHLESIESIVAILISSMENGGKLLLCGNGGSAADAQHIAAEFIVRFKRKRVALPAIALTTDSSIITAGGNDLGFNSIFERQVSGLGKAGDVLFGISTSGNSPNILAAMRIAREIGITTIGFTGSSENVLHECSDCMFCAPSEVTARIQECHILAGHIICDLVDAYFSNDRAD